MKDAVQRFVDWLAIGASLLWLCGLGLLFANSALTAGWLVDFFWLVLSGPALIWAIWWIIRSLLPRRQG